MRLDECKGLRDNFRDFYRLSRLVMDLIEDETRFGGGISARPRGLLRAPGPLLLLGRWGRDFGLLYEAA